MSGQHVPQQPISPRAGRSRVSLMIGGIVSLPIVLGLAGCGAESSTTPVAERSPAAGPVQSAAPVTPTAAPTQVPDAPPPPAPTGQPAPAPAPAEASPASMPNVMCMNLQAAQNLIQVSGVFFSRSTDATGRDRMQVNDSNWVVVGQTPTAGSPIGEGDAELSVVKIGEPSPC